MTKTSALAAMRKETGHSAEDDGLCKAARQIATLSKADQEIVNEAILDLDNISSRVLVKHINSLTERTVAEATLVTHRGQRCRCYDN